jgi:hypothetical protein
MMLLQDLKTYMQTKKTATLHDMLQHFQLSEHAQAETQIKMKHWIDKGFAIKKNNSLPCGKSCNQCTLSPWTESYEWIV